jgi:hypothetical protein
MGVIFNGVGVSTYKELALAPVIDKGVSCLSFRLEDEEKLVPYEYFGEQLGCNKEAQSKLMSKKKR